MHRTSRSLKSLARLPLMAGVLFSSLTLSAPGWATSSCASGSDTQALQVRTLQSHLMVAGLSCGQSVQYNAFIQRFQGELISQGQALKSYFNRSYGGAGRRELNAYVTRMANEASQYSMRDRGAFCQESLSVFTALEGIPTRDLAVYIDGQQPFGTVGNSCGSTRTAQK